MSLKAEASYYLNGEKIENYTPTETWDESGRHILTLNYTIVVEPGTLNVWRVSLKGTGGKMIIKPEHARALIWGQGLVSAKDWDGFIDVEDKLEAIPLDSIEIAELTDEATVGVVTPHELEPADSMGAIPLDSIEIAVLTDVAYINKLSIYDEGLSWSTLSTMTWAELADEWLW